MTSELFGIELLHPGIFLFLFTSTLENFFLLAGKILLIFVIVKIIAPIVKTAKTASVETQL